MKRTKKKSMHGGPRPGSGMKPIFGAPMVRLTIRVPQEYKDFIDWAYGNPTIAIRTLIEKDMLPLPKTPN